MVLPGTLGPARRGLVREGRPLAAETVNAVGRIASRSRGGLRRSVGPHPRPSLAAGLPDRIELLLEAVPGGRVEDARLDQVGEDLGRDVGGEAVVAGGAEALDLVPVDVD